MLKAFSLENKTILVNGASSGIGRQCAINCSKMGANVILVARNEARMDETHSKLKEGNHLVYSQDVTDYHELESVVHDAVGKIGNIYGFIHSAGIETTLPLRMMKPNHYEELFSTNIISGFEFARIISKKKYVDSNGASFIFISSIMSMVANAALVGYCASKGALVAGARSLAVELARNNIRVNCVSPGYIQTEMMKKAEKNMSREEAENLKNQFLLGLGQPEDVANSCVYLLSEASKWITGTNLIVDGGYSAK